MDNLGNQLHRIIKNAIIISFDQVELAELTYGAFDIAARSIQLSDQEEIIVSFPIGYRPDKTPIESTRTYKKEKLLLRYH
jgi:hypothetical protein